MDDFYYRPVPPKKEEEDKPQKAVKRDRPRSARSQGKLGQKLAKFNPFKRGFGKMWKDAFRGKDWKQIAILTGTTLVGLFAIGFVALALMIAVLSIGLPDVNDLDKLAVAQSTTIYDREGNILYTKHGGENREYVEIDKISQNLIDATVALEDDRFWEHTGFDPTAILRAVFGQLTGNSRGGGSTITQQYVKNAFLSPEKTYTRKVKELILAVRLEQEFDKEKILELYLNKIPYGNNAYGIQKAAETYFGKDAADLSLAESAILAGLPQAPSYYNPYGDHRYSQLTVDLAGTNRNIQSEADLKDEEFLRGVIGQEITIDEEQSVYIQGRSDIVLRAMENVGYITEEERETTLQELQNYEFQKYREKISAPHYVFYILSQLEQKYGTEIVEQGGLKVYTSLDPKLQEYAEEAVEEGAAHNTENFNVNNASLVALDPKTGDILAMVGSKDYFAEDIDGAVNIATQYRQPGSSFKPIVFAEAFKNRYAPASIIFDAETRFGSSSFPQNYDGTFMGPISIRKALAQSRNIPAIKAYFLAGEHGPIIELGQKMGIVFLDPDREDYGWPLALGAAEVQPMSMVASFGTFANSGVHQETTAILKVENAQGEVLDERKESNGEEALDPQIAYLINDILSDESVRLGPQMSVSGHNVASKTGTSTDPDGDAKDLWTIGYTPTLVAGVWAGNNTSAEGKPAKSASGYTNAAPIWNDFMNNALSEMPSENFERPEGIKEVQVSRMSGLLPGPNTPSADIITEIFASFAVPTDIDNSAQLVEVDTRNNLLANKYCPEEAVANRIFINIQDIEPFENWQAGAEAWMKANSEKLSITSSEEGEDGENSESEPIPTAVSGIIYGAPPMEESPLCSKERAKDAPTVTITEPDKGDTLKSNTDSTTTITVQINTKSKNQITKAEYFLDGTFKYRTDDAPFTGNIRLPRGETGLTEHTIEVKVFDEFGYTGTDEVTFRTSPSANSDSGSSSSSNNNQNDRNNNDEEEENNSSSNNGNGNGNGNGNNNTSEEPDEIPPIEETDPVDDIINEIEEDLGDLPTI